MYVRITRYFRSEVQCRGYLSVIEEEDKLFECKTLELPWKDNRVRESCIPPGPEGHESSAYSLAHRGASESGNFKYHHFLVEGVPNRTYILIHAGNLYTQILGCILVGKEFVDLNDDGHPDVTSSRDTLRELRSIVPSGTRLVVRWIDQMGLDERKMKGAAPNEEPNSNDLPDLSTLSE